MVERPTNPRREFGFPPLLSIAWIPQQSARCRLDFPHLRSHSTGGISEKPRPVLQAHKTLPLRLPAGATATMSPRRGCPHGDDVPTAAETAVRLEGTEGRRQARQKAFINKQDGKASRLLGLHSAPRSDKTRAGGRRRQSGFDLGQEQVHAAGRRPLVAALTPSPLPTPHSPLPSTQHPAQALSSPSPGRTAPGPGKGPQSPASGARTRPGAPRPARGASREL